MDKDYIMNNTGVSPWTEPSCGADQSFLESSHDQFSQLDSSLQSNDTFALCKLIGKLGNGMGTPAAFPAAESSNFASATTDCSSLASCKLNLPILDPMSISNLVSSATLAPPLPSLAADPGFAERAAKFSCFGSRSFNGRSPPQLVLSSNLYSEGNGKLSRVSSSPVIKQGGSGSRKSGQMEIHRHSTANEDSSVSEQMPTGETGSKISNELSSRKRKSAKTREDGSNSDKVVKGGENKNAKRSKQNGGGKIEAQTKEETKGAPNDESEKLKANQKPPEPPKDYIHVRARRGQATDSHSLAERVRREKISERMKLLQDLVPGCNKVTGKALMLDEIINYVQSLQRQVEFLSMKLASVNPGLDFNIENLLSKDMFQQNAVTLPQQMYPLDSSSPAFYQPNVHHNHSNGANISVGPLSQCPVDPLPVHARHLGIHLPTVEMFNETLLQFPSFSEDELQSIVQMGIVPSPTKFPVSNPMPNMKVER